MVEFSFIYFFNKMRCFASMCTHYFIVRIQGSNSIHLLVRTMETGSLSTSLWCAGERQPGNTTQLFWDNFTREFFFPFLVPVAISSLYAYQSVKERKLTTRHLKQSHTPLWQDLFSLVSPAGSFQLHQRAMAVLGYEKRCALTPRRGETYGLVQHFAHN